MADITVTAANVKPLRGCKTVRKTAGGAGNVGDTVYIAADADVEEADASAAGTTYAIGVVVSISGTERTAFIEGDELDIAVDGLVTGFSGMTPNDVLYQSDTAGALADAAGTTSHKMGKAFTATEVYIKPQLTEA